jgi:hypothetical protein
MWRSLGNQVSHMIRTNYPFQSHVIVFGINDLASYIAWQDIVIQEGK